MLASIRTVGSRAQVRLARESLVRSCSCMYLFDHQMAAGGEMPRRASIFEIVGAWLRVWTPPRDVEIPPVPWRKLAIATGVAIVVLGAALAVLVPRIDSAKESRAAKDAAAAAHARAANRARIVAEQRPRHRSHGPPEPAAGPPP